MLARKIVALLLMGTITAAAFSAPVSAASSFRDGRSHGGRSPYQHADYRSDWHHHHHQHHWHGHYRY